MVIAIEGLATRFRQWSDSGSDRKYNSKFGEYAKNAVLMCARFSLATVAIEQSLLPARTRATLARILRSEMRVPVRRTTIRFAIGIWHKGVPTRALDGKLLARIRVFSGAGLRDRVARDPARVQMRTTRRSCGCRGSRRPPSRSSGRPNRNPSIRPIDARARSPRECQSACRPRPPAVH